MAGMDRRMARDVVLFHCPACGTDRLGVSGRRSWRSWLRDHGLGAHLTCVGCRRMFDTDAAIRGPVGISARARLNLAVRAMAASIVAAGDGDPRTTSAALELVRSCTMLDYTQADLRSDVATPRLRARLRGDLTLLATDLRPEGATQLLAQLRRVLDTGARVTTEQRAVIGDCTQHLGLGSRSVTSAPDPRRRRPTR
jgi:hypothetical protein